MTHNPSALSSNGRLLPHSSSHSSLRLPRQQTISVRLFIRHHPRPSAPAATTNSSSSAAPAPSAWSSSSPLPAVNTTTNEYYARPSVHPPPPPSLRSSSSSFSFALPSIRLGCTHHRHKPCFETCFKSIFLNVPDLSCSKNNVGKSQ
jgi:hypothetical protein